MTPVLGLPPCPGTGYFALQSPQVSNGTLTVSLETLECMVEASVCVRSRYHQSILDQLQRWGIDLASRLGSEQLERV